jgi:hypothetical protein
MARHKMHRHHKSAAIRTALGTLGWHGSAKDVVAMLANYGLHVNEGLVQKVKLEALKETGKFKCQMAAARRLRCRQQVPFIKKIPIQRTYRR